LQARSPTLIHDLLFGRGAFRELVNAFRGREDWRCSAHVLQ